MAKIYYEGDADLTLLKKKVIGVMGYGSQGHAHAQNLRDSGCQVIVAEAEDTPGWKNAQDANFRVLTAAEVAKEADIIIMLLPDNLHRDVYYGSIKKGLARGNMLMFAHGFNIHYGQIIPPPDIDVAMIAPKCPGHMLRQLYTEGAGPPAVMAVHQDTSGKARDLALAYAKGIGCSRAGVIETTFAEETETDLFGEQTVLCGGVSSLIKAGFETLVEAGYQLQLLGSHYPWGFEHGHAPDFQMTIQELATIVQENIAVKIAILNNGYLGMVRQWQELFYKRRYVATPLSCPDFVKIAEAYGLPGIRVKHKEEVAPAIERAMEHQGPFMIDFMIEPEENVYPMVPPGASLAEVLEAPKKEPKVLSDSRKLPVSNI